MDTFVNKNLINLIASFKKTQQSDEVIRQSLWQMGMIPDVIDSHLEYYNKNIGKINKELNNTVKENKDMKLTLEKLHKEAKRAISALEEMKSDNTLAFSAKAAQSVIESGLAALQISNDNEMVMEEKIKAGYKIDDTLVNPVIKYGVAESMFRNLNQFEWLMPVADLRNMISETFVGDKWSYVAANLASKVSGNSNNAAFASLYEALVNTLIDEKNTRLALKTVLLENSWNSDAKNVLASIVAEEKAERGEVDERIYENNSCSIKKNISPSITDGDRTIFNLNGKNYICDGKTLTEAAVSDRRYLNVLEGLSLMKYDADKDRLVYYGKNNLVFEYNCSTNEISLTGVENLNEMSILDVHNTMMKSGLFNMETAGDCDKLVKMVESKDLITDIDTVTTIQNDKFPGVFVSIINVQEGVYVNKVNAPFGYNEIVLCESAKKACEEIKDFMKYDATNILKEKLAKEGEQEAILESKRAEIKDTITFLSEKRAELVKAFQETDNNEQIGEAIKLVESETRKFEKELQTLYTK